MAGYHSLSFNLELMYTPDGVEAELYSADEVSEPLATATGPTADAAIQALFGKVTFDGIPEEEPV